MIKIGFFFSKQMSKERKPIQSNGIFFKARKSQHKKESVPIEIETETLIETNNETDNETDNEIET